jgi:hypothetical protein
LKSRCPGSSPIHRTAFLITRIKRKIYVNRYFITSPRPMDSSVLGATAFNNISATPQACLERQVRFYQFLKEYTVSESAVDTDVSSQRGGDLNFARFLVSSVACRQSFWQPCKVDFFNPPPKIQCSLPTPDEFFCQPRYLHFGCAGPATSLVRVYVEQLTVMKERELNTLYVDFQHLLDTDQVCGEMFSKHFSCFYPTSN